MSSRSDTSQDEPFLFEDLPLRSEVSAETDTDSEPFEPEPESAPKSPKPKAAPDVEKLPLFPETEKAEKNHSRPVTPPARTISRPAAAAVVPVGARLAAAAIDFGVVLMVLTLTAMGLRWLGVELSGGAVAPLLLFLLSFYFMYFVFPLAFWGRTPGMAQVGLAARCSNGQTLTFSQAAQRWLGAVLTVVGLGLPLIVTISTGRSLADRLSDSNVNPCNR